MLLRVISGILIITTSAMMVFVLSQSISKVLEQQQILGAAAVFHTILFSLVTIISIYRVYLMANGKLEADMKYFVVINILASLLLTVMNFIMVLYVYGNRDLQIVYVAFRISSVVAPLLAFSTLYDAIYTVAIRSTWQINLSARGAALSAPPPNISQLRMTQKQWVPDYTKPDDVATIKKKKQKKKRKKKGQGKPKKPKKQHKRQRQPSILLDEGSDTDISIPSFGTPPLNPQQRYQQRQQKIKEQGRSMSYAPNLIGPGISPSKPLAGKDPPKSKPSKDPFKTPTPLRRTRTSAASADAYVGSSAKYKPKPISESPWAALLNKASQLEQKQKELKIQESQTRGNIRDLRRKIAADRDNVDFDTILARDKIKRQQQRMKEWKRKQFQRSSTAPTGVPKPKPQSQLDQAK